MLDHVACYRAFEARDRRFDGRVFVGVRTTGVYCRPVCPARTPKSKNCAFYSSAAAAQAAGFRPCLRCRPERSPGAPSFRGTSNTVTRAVALIAEGALAGEDANVAALSDRLGVGERQLRRLFDAHLGASPLAVAHTRRVLFAKQLIQETRLSMTDVALAAGFGSVRRFNDTFRKLFGRPPRELRRTALETDDLPSQGSPVVLRLGYRPPYDFESILGFFAARAIPGVEHVEAGRYLRSVRYGAATGTVEITHAEAESALVATIRFPAVEALPAIVRRIRQAFDLDADIETIERHLSREPWMRALVARRPGLRVPGSFDGFETAVRALLGQQITVVQARRLAGVLTAIAGTELPGGEGAVTRVFPTPEAVVACDVSRVGVTPGAKARALSRIAARAVEEPTWFASAPSLDEGIARLCSISGVGEWTAQYIALRALREPDAFPASDVGLLRSAAIDGTRPTPTELLARVERFRPWRGYAAQHLWTHEAVAGLPPSRVGRRKEASP